MIMPLANSRDKYTQVYWGVKDFRMRFKREPEGMWLPETAVDLETLDIMASLGIKFTVLAPRQAKRVRDIDKADDWKNVEGSQIDPTMTYQCILPSGRSIALYFYDGPISQGIAFEGLLKSGETFANRLLGAFNNDRKWDQLVHIATDGETYGHHHKYGDMALAYAVYYLESNDSVRMTNYGEFLEKHPPTRVVEIFENSSWSCVHGVERWRENCGCNSGGHPGWQQMWRRPLRDALDALRDRCIPIFEREGSKRLKDPWQARNEYIDVVNDRNSENVEKFLSAHASHDLSPEDEQAVLKLLGAQRCAMLMYTSCGWFFDELSGIETTQVLQYGSRMIQLLENITPLPLESDFVEDLEKAPSNTTGNGAKVYELYVRPARVDISRAVAHHVISSLFLDLQGDVHEVYSYQLENEAYERKVAGPRRFAAGKIKARNKLTREHTVFAFAALTFGDTSVTAGLRQFRSDEAFEEMREEIWETFRKGDVPEMIRAMDSNFPPPYRYSLHHLFRDEQRNIVDEILKPKYDQIDDLYLSIHEGNYAVMDFLRSVDSPLPKPFLYATEATIDIGLSRIFDTTYNIHRLRQLIEEANKWSITIDRDGLGLRAVSWIDERVKELVEKPGEAEPILVMEKIKDTIQILNEIPLELHPWRAQNMYFGLTRDVLPAITKRADEGEYEAQRWVHAFKELGEFLRIRI
jgi:hypothetical protein